MSRIPLFLFLLALLPVGAAAAAPDAPHALSPLPEKEWDLGKAEHLLRRAGFGGTREEVEALFALGIKGAVDSLVNFQGKQDRNVPQPSITLTDRPGRMEYFGKTREEQQKIRREHRRKDGRQFAAIRAWWMSVMINTDHPLRERMTLFWHGHFTSSMRDVRNSYHMFVQNTLLRRQAAGNFGELLHEISADPAMLEYLDNNRNRASHPNENYAREVMELFTLGEGNYAEDDIKEAARAFTGWTFRGNRFVFDFRNHDPGEKTFLGKTGRFDGDDVLDIILEQPATSRYVSAKIFRYFVHGNPSPEVAEGLARTFKESGYELKPLLRQIFLSREFYSSRARGTKIKSPVELVVMLYRELGMKVKPTPALPAIAASLGQGLMAPPTVKGWDGGRDWITTSHLLNRYNLAGAVVGLPQDRIRTMRAARVRGMGAGLGEAMPADGAQDDSMSGKDPEAMPGPGRRRGRRTTGLVFDAAGEVGKHGLTTPGEIVDHFTALLLATAPSSQMRRTLIEYLNEDGEFDAKSFEGRQRLHGLLRLIVSTPEFQLT